MARDDKERLATGVGGTVLYEGWPRGVNNVDADVDVPPSQLRDAVNVVLRDSGAPKRRPGYTTTSITDPVLAAKATRHHLLYKVGDTVHSVNRGLLAVDSLAGFRDDTLLASTLVNGDLYVSDGTKSARMLDSTGDILDGLGMESPTSAPVLVAGSGELPAGQYLVAVTFVSASGLESGASQVASITLSTTGGITLSSIPKPTGTEALYVKVYVSNTDGSELYYNEHLIDATLITYNPMYTVAIKPRIMVEPLETLNMVTLPHGDVLAFAQGRVVSALGQVAFYSEPLRFGVTNPGENFLMFAEPITLMFGAANGLYVCAGKTYFISDLGKESMSMQELLPYGAVKGTLTVLPDQSGALWMSDQGIVKASYSSAQVEPVSHAMGVRTAGAESGASVVVQDDGVQTAVFVNKAPKSYTGVAAGDFFDAEVIRNSE